MILSVTTSNFCHFTCWYVFTINVFNGCRKSYNNTLFCPTHHLFIYFILMIHILINAYHHQAFLKTKVKRYVWNISNIYIYMVSQEECARLREGVPYVKVHRYNPKHLCPKLNGYRDNGQRKVWSCGGSTHCTCSWQSYLSLSMSLVSYDGKSEREVVWTINTRENILQMVLRSPRHV
jgi:hypothetical protein